jgi:hypothetical protein
MIHHTDGNLRTDGNLHQPPGVSPNVSSVDGIVSTWHV